jgi:hypothetical protein
MLEKMHKINNKIGKTAAKATHHAVQYTASAVAPTRLVDEQLKASHERLAALQTTYSELHSALKHQVLNARKMGKTVKESNAPMLGIAGVVAPEARRSVQTAMAVDTAIARTWEDYATHLEAELVTPAKQECSSLFAEGDSIWTSYIAIVNELAAREGKEKLKEKLFKTADDSTSALNAKKQQHESTMLPRLTALANGAERAMAYLVEGYRQLHAAHHRDVRAHSPPRRRTRCAALAAVSIHRRANASVRRARRCACACALSSARAWQALAAASAASPDLGNLPERGALLASMRTGWIELQSASGSASAATPPPMLRGLFGTPLDVLSRRADAVGGVPLVAHALVHRLLTGTSDAGQPFTAAEGLFRIQADADEIDGLRRQLDASADTAVRAAAALAPAAPAAALPRHPHAVRELARSACDGLECARRVGVRIARSADADAPLARMSACLSAMTPPSSSCWCCFVCGRRRRWQLCATRTFWRPSSSSGCVGCPRRCCHRRHIVLWSSSGSRRCMRPRPSRLVVACRPPSPPRCRSSSAVWRRPTWSPCMRSWRCLRRRLRNPPCVRRPPRTLREGHAAPIHCERGTPHPLPERHACSE